MQHILISGGSGLLGRALTSALQEKGYQVAWLSRKAGMEGKVRRFGWDVDRSYIDPDAIAWADAIVHLAGEGIADKRWTNKRKQQIIGSRVRAAELLMDAIAKHPGKIKTIVSASAIGFYGKTTKPAVEEQSAGNGFLSESVTLWEQATSKFQTTGARCVTLRIGIVLSRAGGAYAELTKTAGLRILPVVGSGKQIYSWIHIDDLVRMMMFALENNITGTFNAVAPAPVNMHDLMHTIARIKRGFYFLPPVPGILLKLVLGELSDTVILSQEVSGKKMLDAGFLFHFPDIGSAVMQLENGG